VQGGWDSGQRATRQADQRGFGDKGFQGKCNSVEGSWTKQGLGGRERVSFGTNMSIEEDVSDEGSVD
jgi:hypothetical protein